LRPIGKGLEFVQKEVDVPLNAWIDMENLPMDKPVALCVERIAKDDKNQGNGS